MTTWSFPALFIAIFCCSGCGRVDAPVVGRYRATVEVAGQELPFFLDVARENDRFVLILPKAGERALINDVHVDGAELTATLPNRSALRVTATRSRLRGTLTIVDQNGTPHALPLVGELGATALFYDEPLTDNADVEGRWEVAVGSTGATVRAVALLEQQHDHIGGTLTLASGEQLDLQGQIRDEEVQLASLSWNDASVYRLKLTERGALEGDAWYLSGAQRTVTAKRNPDAMLDTAQAGNGRATRNSL